MVCPESDKPTSLPESHTDGAFRKPIKARFLLALPS